MLWKVNLGNINGSQQRHSLKIWQKKLRKSLELENKLKNEQVENKLKKMIKIH